MELDVSGLEDGDTECKLSTAERFAQLKTTEQGWDNLRFRQRHRARLPPSNIWELFGGVLAHGVLTPIARGLSFIQLPSAVRGTDSHTWQHRDLGVDIRDFTIDPAQDLAVLIAQPDIVISCVGLVILDCASCLIRYCRNPPLRKFLIHLRTMSGGGSHPSASDPVISCVASRDSLEYDFVIQIMGEYLAVLFHTPFPSWEDELFIWDWKRTELLTVRL